jgi:hypothetical protein
MDILIQPRRDRKAALKQMRKLLKKQCVSRVNRRMCIRRFKFCRSARLIEICFGSGLPSIPLMRAPMHSAGL